MIRLLRSVGPPVLLLFMLLAIWQGIVSVFRISPIILPGPLGIYEVAASDPRAVIHAFWTTTKQAVCGFALSITIGFLIAICFSQSSVFRRCAFPYAIMFQTIPIIAIAPVIIIWFGRGFAAIVVVSFLIALFPIITNTTSGLINVTTGHVELFRLNRATRWQLLWKLQIPSAMPDFVNGAKVSAGLSVLGAIIGEYFAGDLQSNRGIGFWIYDSRNLQLDRLFVYVFASTLLGVSMFLVVTFIGDKIILSWRERALK